MQMSFVFDTYMYDFVQEIAGVDFLHKYAWTKVHHAALNLEFS